MKKIILILSLLFLVNLTFSQEVKSVYRFKKEVKKRFFTNYELDSLVLYEDGSFYRKQHFIYHEVVLYDTEGKWKIENGKLILNTTKKIYNSLDSKLVNTPNHIIFTIKRKKLIPISNLPKHKLKLVK